MPVACRGPPGGQKHDIHLTVEPPTYVTLRHTFMHVTITKPRSALLHLALIGVSRVSPTLAGLHCGSVCVSRLACLRPYTINFKCTFKYF